MESFVLTPKHIIEKREIEMNFFLPFRDSKVLFYKMSVVSDTWITDPEYFEYSGFFGDLTENYSQFVEILWIFLQIF